MTKRDQFYSVCEIGERADRLSQDIGAHLPAADSELHGTLHRVGLVAFELARSIHNRIVGIPPRAANHGRQKQNDGPTR